MATEFSVETLRKVITRAFPCLTGSTFRLLTEGWHSTAVDVDDRLVFKFPRHAAAARALVREAGLLAVIRPAVTMPVPDLTLHPGPPLFSRHRKLKGEHLLRAQYLSGCGTLLGQVRWAVEEYGWRFEGLGRADEAGGAA